MSDIGLLMTSVLLVGQKVASNLPQQLLVQHESNLLQESAHLINSTTTLQVTPPEFSHDNTFSLPRFSSNPNVKKILSNLLDKVSEKGLSDLEPDELSTSMLVAQREIIADDSNSSVIAAINRRRSTSNLPRVEFGDSGITVRVVQKLLVSSGYSLDVDGFFGALTETAVKAFQTQRNIVTDGIVGQNTWRELTFP